jgi:AraC-like DNA-binding protein
LPTRADKILFTTRDLPSPQQLDAWNAAFGSLNEISVPEATADTLPVRSENWHFGGMVLSLTSIPTSRFVRDAQRARQDGFDHWVVRVLRKGRYHAQHPAFSGWIEPGQPVLFSMHDTWAIDWHAPEWVSLCIPRDLNPQLSAALGAVRHGPLHGASAGLLGDLLLALPERLVSAAPRDLPALVEATQAVVAACVGAGASQGGTNAAALYDLQKERVRKAIHRHIGSARLSPARLAAAAGLSRSALYRMFAEEGGVARYVRDVRLSMAHAALRDPAQLGLSIAQVAEAHGFPDPSAFSRAFRQSFGATPGDVRMSGRPGPAPSRALRQARPANDQDCLATRIYGTR